MITNERGEFSGTLKERNNYKIESGLPTDPGGIAAISFPEISESGASLSARSPITIDMERNIDIDGDVCRVLQGNVEMVFFPYENTTRSIPGMPDGVPIEIPLDYGALNQIFSPVGNPNPAPAPDDLFYIGKQGFARQLEAFRTTEDTYLGSWKLLGRSVDINGLPEICTDRGDDDEGGGGGGEGGGGGGGGEGGGGPGEGGGACKITDEKVMDQIWRYANRTVVAQIELANSLAGKRWTPNPRNRLFITKRGAMVLAALRKAIVPYYNTYTCQVVAAACRTIKIDKDKIRVIFSGLYTKVPKGLEPLGNDKVKRKKYIEALLKKLPAEVTSCP